MRTGRFFLIKAILSLNLFFLSSCYRVPQEGEYSVIPATNNPSVVGTHGSQNFLPESGF